MKVTLEFYGRLKEQFSATPLTVEINHELDSIKSIYLWLCQQQQTQPEINTIKPILNDTFADWDDSVSNNDVVGFLPPASGG